MARKVRQIDNSYGKYSPEVVARPVDTYVTPARDTGNASEYRSLAGALAGIHDPLAKFAAKREKEREQAGLAKGQQLYNQNPDRLSWEDYVKQNPSIPVNQHMKRGYLMARASNEADILKTALYQAYNDGSATVEIDGRTVNIAESDDKAAFDTWVRGFTNKYIMENMGDDVDPEIYSGILMPQVEESVRALTNQHIAHRQDVLLTKTKGEHTQLIQNIVREYTNGDGVFHLNGLEGNLELAGRISSVARSMHTQGVPLAEAQASVYNAILALADDDSILDREQLIDVAKNVSIMDGVLLGNDPDFVVKIQNDVESLQMQREQREEREYRKQERERAKRIDDVQKAFMMDVIAGRGLNQKMLMDFARTEGVTPEEINAFRAYATSIENDLFPKADASAIREQRKQVALMRQLNFATKVQANRGRFTVDDVRNSGMDLDDQIKYIEQLTGDDTARAKLVQDSLVKDIPDIVRIQIFENKDTDADANTAAVVQTARLEVETAVRQRMKADPSLETDPTRIIGAINDEAIRLKPDIQRRLDVVEEELKAGTSLNEPQKFSKAGQDKALVELYSADLDESLRKHNNWAEEGYDVSNSAFIRTLTRLGYSVADYEKVTKKKVNMNRTTPNRRELKPRPK